VAAALLYLASAAVSVNICACSEDKNTDADAGKTAATVMVSCLTTAGNDAANVKTCLNNVDKSKLPHLTWLFEENPTPPAGFSQNVLNDYEKAFYEALQESDVVLSIAGITLPDIDGSIEPDNRPVFFVLDGTSEDALVELLENANTALRSSKKLSITAYSSSKQNNVAFILKEVLQVDSAARKSAITREYTINGEHVLGVASYLEDTTVYNYSGLDMSHNFPNRTTIYCKNTYGNYYYYDENNEIYYNSRFENWFDGFEMYVVQRFYKASIVASSGKMVITELSDQGEEDIQKITFTEDKKFKKLEHIFKYKARTISTDSRKYEYDVTPALPAGYDDKSKYTDLCTNN
jgi:hypothetical protein